MAYWRLDQSRARANAVRCLGPILQMCTPYSMTHGSLVRRDGRVGKGRGESMGHMWPDFDVQ